MGNPNVGKSVLFSRLNGLNVIASNYAGTTISFTKGYMKAGEKKNAELFDVPGTYTLNPTSEAEKVATEMLKKGDIIINVLDATNLERNLFLTMQLIALGKPMIIVLNMWDETKHKGIEIDFKKLGDILGVPIIHTCALSGEGIKHLSDAVREAKASSYINEKLKNLKNHYIWDKIGEIIPQVQALHHHHHTFFQVLSEISIKPATGIPFALGVLYLSFTVIRFIGEGLINRVFDPFFEGVLTPILMKFSSLLGPSSFLHKVLIGNLINGEIDYLQSFGILSSGIYIPFAAVLPYVFAFYLVLTLLEDSGYLPRLAVLMDGLFHKIGLHGYAIIPTLLGLGCNVPAIMATRILESKKERFIVSTLISIAVPCSALQAMIFGIMGKYGFKYILALYGILFILWILIGMVLNKILKGFSPEFLMEVPPYRVPPFKMMLKKLYFRIKGFLAEALPVVLIGIFIVNFFYVFGIFEFISNLSAPIITRLFGLPKDAVIAIVLGFLRKDIAMGMLLPLDLTLSQLFTATIVLAMTFPCIATFTIMWKELGMKYMLYSVIVMFICAVFAGTMMNLLL